MEFQPGAATSPRVVTVSSMVRSEGRIDFDDMDFERNFNGYHAYSKPANVLFANELARRESWLTSNSLHPGVTGIKLLHAAFSMQGDSVTARARTSVYLASSPDVARVTGNHFDNYKVVEASAKAQDQHLAQRL